MVKKTVTPKTNRLRWSNFKQCFKKLTLKKLFLYLHLGCLFILIGYGINDYVSGKSLGGDYWATLIMLIAILPGTLHIQNKE